MVWSIRLGIRVGVLMFWDGRTMGFRRSMKMMLIFPFRWTREGKVGKLRFLCRFMVEGCLLDQSVSTLCLRERGRRRRLGRTRLLVRVVTRMLLFRIVIM